MTPGNPIRFSPMAAVRWLRRLSREYAAVQDEGAIDSLRRFLATLYLFVPLELALAGWFARYQAPGADPVVQDWARGLFLTHAATAVLTLILAAEVRSVLARRTLKTGLAVALQVVMCAVYIGYAAVVTYIDLKIGVGIAPFIIVAIGVAGLSLMRPGISLPLFLTSLLVFLHMLEAADIPAAALVSLRVNATSAIVLAIGISAITWHQYARAVQLRRELRRSFDELTGTQRELEKLARHDPLTDLPNRRYMHERLQQALALSARNGRSGALLFIDLDNFKLINDTCGHDTGDLLLKWVAQRISSGVREADTVARLGGDEFVVMLENLGDAGDASDTAARHAETVAEKILHTLNAPVHLDGHDHTSTPSIGIALFNGNELGPEEVMKRADMAMYQAKAAGRNTARFYDPAMQAQVDARLALERDLRQGIEAEQLVLHYQPQIDAEGRVMGVEALVRWCHPQRGMVSPAQFIPLAEETGLILPLGHWVLTAACRQLAAWQGDPVLGAIPVAINVSAGQFLQDEFVTEVMSMLAQCGVPPARLKIELTESLLVSDIDQVVGKMRTLRAHGVQFSLDDFGTGYSSLTYLRRLPLNVLKIDQSFVRAALTEHSAGSIVRTIVALGNSLGLEVIAEGVETEQQREFLAQAGCHAFQGYLYARPLPGPEVEAFIRSRPRPA